MDLGRVLEFLIRPLCRISPKPGLKWSMNACAGHWKLAQGILHDDGGVSK